ncbi:MAG: hypothetical protein KDA57_19465 [Planctomycetales bacterium]|nr:hypothetical protein [Planctomycetales bacterium]
MIARSLFLSAVTLAIASCGSAESPSVRVIGIAEATGPAGMQTAARLTSAFYSEGRYKAVLYPGGQVPSVEDESTALSKVVVQPAFREHDPNGAVFVRCTIHHDDVVVAQILAGRCEDEIRALAREQDISLSWW